MSDLRDRIAGLQRFHIPVDYAGYIECSCGTECKPDHGGIDVAEQMWGEHVADAVIAELGLRMQRQSGDIVNLIEGDDINYARHRYVTDWKAD